SMTPGKRLEQIVGAGARIAQAEAWLDSAAAQRLDEIEQRAVDKAVAGGDVRTACGQQRPAGRLHADAEVNPRLDDVPAVDEQHHRASAAGHDSLQALGDQIEHPRRLAHYLTQAVAVEPVAIHAR